MIDVADVNEAVIRHAAEELEIGVPIRAWRVEDGELVLSLAYGGEARWGNVKHEGLKRDESRITHHESRNSRPWRFVEGNRKPGARPIPRGDLGRLKKQALQLTAHEWGFQTESLYPKKAEFVEALEWLREEIGRPGYWEIGPVSSPSGGLRHG